MSEFDQSVETSWAKVLELEKEDNSVFKIDQTETISRKLPSGRVLLFNPKTNTKKVCPELKEASQEIFQLFDENKFNFTKVKPEEILFYVDLENEEVISTEEKQKRDAEEGEEALEKEISEDYLHPVIINARPVAPYHLLIPLSIDEGLPQVISLDLINLLLQVFVLSKNPNLRICYNSLGAASSVNHLHFQTIYTDKLMLGSDKLPIEEAETAELYSTPLENDEVDVFTVAISLQEVTNFATQAFVLQAKDVLSDINHDQAIDSVSQACGMITNFFIDKSIAHNVIFSENGLKVYIFPRNFENWLDEAPFYAGFLEVSGVFSCRNKEFYENATDELVDEYIAKEIALDKMTYDQLKTELVEKLASHQWV